jgi:hypothetical protein
MIDAQSISTWNLCDFGVPQISVILELLPGGECGDANSLGSCIFIHIQSGNL